MLLNLQASAAACQVRRCGYSQSYSLCNVYYSEACQAQRTPDAQLRHWQCRHGAMPACFVVPAGGTWGGMCLVRSSASTCVSLSSEMKVSAQVWLVWMVMCM